MRGLVTLVAIYALIGLMLLSGCGNGRWVVHDLSSASFQFTPVAVTAGSPAARP